MAQLTKMTKKSVATALNELATRDSDIARVIQEVGYPEPRNRETGFGTFVSIIIGQQVSTHAAAAIRGRLAVAANPLTPETLLALDDDALKGVGLSRRKMEYCRLLAQDVLEGRFDPEGLHMLEDEAVMESIIARKGLGRWSAEIYMLFALGRADVWPADDLAVMVAVQRLKGLPDRPNRAVMDTLAENWRPYRGIVALLMWHHYNNAAL